MKACSGMNVVSTPKLSNLSVSISMFPKSKFSMFLRSKLSVFSKLKLSMLPKSKSLKLKLKSTPRFAPEFMSFTPLAFDVSGNRPTRV